MRTHKFSTRFRLLFSLPEGEEGGGGGGDDTPEGDLGFPANTATKDMTAEQQAAYYKNASKKWEKKAKASEKNVKPANFDQIAADADAFRKLQEDGKSPDQKAIDAAIAQAKADALRDVAPTLVRSEFARRLPTLDEEQLDELMEDVGAEQFFKNGSVDKERVERIAKRFASAPEGDPDPNPAPAFNLGHILGATSEPAKGTSSSIAEAQQRTLAKYQTNSK